MQRVSWEALQLQLSLLHWQDLDNMVEISPDGTRWISIPIVESGANSSTFKGTIGFGLYSSPLTTNTSTSVTAVILDHTGTATLVFSDGTSDGRFSATNRIGNFIERGL